MSREQRIEQLANLLAVRLGDAPLDEMGAALVLCLASVITGYGPAQRDSAHGQFVSLLDLRLAQLAQAGVETTY